MRIHVGPQYGVDARLIAFLPAEPLQEIRIEPNGDRLLRCRHHYSSLLPEFGVSRLRIRIDGESLSDLTIFAS